MSARHRKAHPCPTATKTAFPDRVAAELALATIRAEYGRAPISDTIPKRAYRCECGKWHLTHFSESYADVAKRLAHNEG